MYLSANEIDVKFLYRYANQVRIEQNLVIICQFKLIKCYSTRKLFVLLLAA